ncbi:MAG: exodeoxyribonuclease V subunit beta [Desulfobacteraceae bacterium]|jgi:exodeoxyribonuclease V beta subunit|nr:exodeoxyribonuclease V subunit beta [Desulfobacteraceae bacterium]
MEPFDLIHAPLVGSNLIEASAGTGKTYNIEGLFIRLVLEMQLPVDQILVLTFTNAATEELKIRIRKKLVQARDAFAAGGKADPLIESLVKTDTDQKAAWERLHDALIDFDQAAIYTIHGFCQRIIHENAFETHSLFDTELVSDQSHLLQEVVDDFWRETFYAAEPEWIGFALSEIKTPEYFVRLLDKVKIPEITVIPESSNPVPEALQPFRAALGDLRNAWPSAREAVIRAMMDPALNATIYGGLKPAASHPGMSQRELKVVTLADAMDRLTQPQSNGFPLFDKFENFTTAKLAKATRKNHRTPEHEFFQLCDAVYGRGEQLTAEFEQSLMDTKIRLFRFAASELRKRKREKNIQYFDDLLLTVLSVLKSENAAQLATGIRQRYKAALVDEFQDTDSVQYDILTRLFAHDDGLLFMIGDPKQSIYSFRGADIFAYTKAARSADARFTLLENWRSEPKMITAVNTLFSGVEKPFIFEDIPFKTGKAALQPLEDDRKLEGPPLTLWYLDSKEITGNDIPLNKPRATRLIAEAVGGEICQLLSQSVPAEPGKIAVLVRTNAQAQLIKDILTARNVPSVLYTAANIFDSREAMEIELILSAIAHPADSSRIKAALATDILGARAMDLISGDLDSRWWEARLIRFREYLEIWQQHSFMGMFRLFLVREGVKDRLLRYLDGERRLTNVLHLLELLHRQSAETNSGIAGLLKWIAGQRDPKTPRLEENQLRLESDENAVKIVTIHKSKGLEYPVVFCPFGWEGSLITDREFTFHDPAKDFQLSLDLGSDSRNLHLAQASNELLSENLRLLYVALTRAKQRCYLAWGYINLAETSALAYLLHGGTDHAGELSEEDQTSHLKKLFKDKTRAELLEDLHRLAARSQNSIEVVPLPVSTDSARVIAKGQETDEPLFCRRFTETINRSWTISSYSSLISSMASNVDLPDRDEALEQPIPDRLPAPDELATKSDPGGLSVFAFPRGARAGSFFHDIFEHYDFAAETSAPLKSLVAGKLQQYGYDAKWQKTVCKVISTVLTVPLLADRSPLKLSSLKAPDRLNEMEFYFPLNPVTPGTLKQAFKTIAGPHVIEQFPARLENLSFAPSVGFMKGFIDLVFRHQGRFYLLDWKSNYLGPTPEHYDQSSLQKAMDAHYYILQYHIYTLALHQYLRYQQPGYSYEKDFGGVFYIFLRGVNELRGPEQGVFYDRPEPALIHSLGQTLIPGYS